VQLHLHNAYSCHVACVSIEPSRNLRELFECSFQIICDLGRKDDRQGRQCLSIGQAFIFYPEQIDAEL